ncbi:hypothetical protein EX895_002268 [Sporisorium graminicola]|uniref:Uncharacterized protein n=1 Tax=Sporisorium graminicola TaxID=280036 RepID=A0A4U7KWS3_9BASI|nr:hypothetical protein EX895_002268 [Sporisorium graminicola]TKY88637.1 hypothetical protein EX895_002268 [Sporisorium graminicola]
MRAIFSSFSRRVNVERGQDSIDTHRKPSTPNAAHIRATYSAVGATGGGIGDAPAKPMVHSTTDGTTSSAWASKFSSSPGFTPPHRRRDAEQNDAETAMSSRPSHPPSSYKQPSSRQLLNTSAARGLVRKWSIAGKRTTSPSNVPVSGSEASVASASAPRQLSPHPDPGPLATAPISNNKTRDSKQISDYSPHDDTNDVMTANGVAKADISVMTSAELASRLNELAVANADDLLTDNEYRTLRQAVFDQMLRADKQSMAAPTDRGLTGIGLQGRNQQPDAAAAGIPTNGNGYLSADLPKPEASRSRSSLGHEDQRPISIHSARSGTSSSFQNVSQFFKNRRQNSQDSHVVQEPSTRDAAMRAAPFRRDSGGLSSHLSSGDSHSQRASSFRTQHSSAAKSMSRMSTLGRLRTGSHSRREQAEAAARDMEEAFSAERTARSLRAVSLYDGGSASISIVGSATHDRSPTSSRAEVAPTTMFGTEYVDKTSSEIQAEIGVVLAEGNRMLGTFTVLEEALLAKQTFLEPLAIKRVIESARDAHPLACVSSLAVLEREGQGVRISRPPPPSSYRPPLTATTAKAVPSPSHDRAYPPGEATSSAEMAAMQVELASIYVQKAAVVKRYQDRLAFLQSKLRSAAIREGLR